MKLNALPFATSSLSAYNFPTFTDSNVTQRFVLFNAGLVFAYSLCPIIILIAAPKFHRCCLFVACCCCCCCWWWYSNQRLCKLKTIFIRLHFILISVVCALFCRLCLASSFSLYDCLLCGELQWSLSDVYWVCAGYGIRKNHYCIIITKIFFDRFESTQRA